MRIFVLAFALLVPAFAACRRSAEPSETPAPPALGTPAQVGDSRAGWPVQTDRHGLEEDGPYGTQGFIYGRVITGDGTYEGRMRWGGDQEAFWGDYFNGTKAENRWRGYAPGAGEERKPLEIFGFEIGGEGSDAFTRQFLARFGEIARIDATFARVQVTLKSGTTVVLDRFSAGDIDDGIRVWDSGRGIVDIDTRDIRTIEFLPTPPLTGVPSRLHGTVRTRQGDFTGFIQWGSRDAVSTDTLDARTPDGDVHLRYDTIRSLTRRSRGETIVTLLDGREMAIAEMRDGGYDNRGIYVDDARYGRVLISWGAIERADFSLGHSGPDYADFAAGRPLSGTVVTRDGRRLTGRLVYDFDESETTETLDAAVAGVDYNIPFRLITSIVVHDRNVRGGRATVVLRGGETLQLERTGDLNDRNAGVLVFLERRERPEYVPWIDVQQIDFELKEGR